MMPTLPDLFERLGTHGEHAGADAVVARAVAAAEHGAAPVAAVVAAPRRNGRRYMTVLTAAALTLALITVPLAVRWTRGTTPSARPQPGPAFPPVASATAAQLAALHWSTIAPAPIPLGTNEIVAWAGDELVVLGQDNEHSSRYGAGARYSPATDRWQTLPRAPLEGSWFFPSGWAWTGRELIVFPNETSKGPLRGEAYSPRTNSWRALAPAPLCEVPQPGVVWTGTVLVVAGGYNLAGSPCSQAGAARTASYDPVTDRWTPGPSLPLRRGDRLEGTKLVWTGDRVIAIVASQRSPAAADAVPSTAAASPTVTTPAVPSRAPLTRSDPIVRSAAWRPGSSTWHGLGDISQGAFGLPYSSRWAPFTAGSRLIFPPSIRFCGEGDVAPCSLLGVQPGRVYDVATGRHVELSTPAYVHQNDLDNTAFSGAALIATAADSSSARAFAWDISTGRRVDLADPPARVFASAWTGRELIAIAFPDGGGQAIGLRLGE
jgi:hypothetical protein